VGERPADKPIAVYGAAAANLLIALAKYTAAAITGSSAMTAEAIHSSVDTANELLLLLGVRRAGRPPDLDHPYGHGKELYFWSLIVAIVVFGLGGGMSIFEGIIHLANPRPITAVGWSYAVLGISAVAEGASWVIAFRELTRSMGRKGFLSALRDSKDPAIFCVLAEDSAALVGILVAFTGIFLSDLLQMPALDGIASIIIGLVLAATALFLVRESRGLLVGEAAGREVVRDILRIAESDPCVARAARPLSMHLGPNEILVNMDVEFKSDISAEEVVRAVDRLERAIRTTHPEVKRVYIEAERLTGGRASGEGHRASLG
jgi:cation diffusion facilitator family transporter